MSSTASTHEDGAQRRHDYRPEGTAKGTSLFATLTNADGVQRGQLERLRSRAHLLRAAGAVPALIALVGLIGLVGDPASTTKTITQIVTKIGPSSAAQTLAGPIKSITSHCQAPPKNVGRSPSKNVGRSSPPA